MQPNNIPPVDQPYRAVSEHYTLPRKVEHITEQHRDEFQARLESHEGPGCPFYGFTKNDQDIWRLRCTT